jgi:hypothetical protein
MDSVESSEHSSRGVIKVLERALAPDLVPKSVMIGGKKVDTVQYIAEIADIARHRGVGIPSSATQSTDEGPRTSSVCLSLNHNRTAPLLAPDAAEARHPLATDETSSGQVSQPDMQS